MFLTSEFVSTCIVTACEMRVTNTGRQAEHWGIETHILIHVNYFCRRVPKLAKSDFISFAISGRPDGTSRLPPDEFS
jgi:hypothetical protein